MLKLRKEFNDAAVKWENEKKYPDFTLSFIASTLVSKGVESFKNLSQKELEKAIQSQYDKEKQGVALFISPQLNEIILHACKEISELEVGIANAIIKRNLV